MITELFNENGTVVRVDDSKEIARGGEGKIIQLNKDSVAKIYLPGISAITEIKFKELSALQTNAFVKPKNLLKDRNGKIVGYIMQMIPPHFFPYYSIYTNNFCAMHKITDPSKVLMLERLSNNVKYVHKQGVVIGDLNPFNILINDTGEMFFIDVDSYETKSQKHSGLMLEEIRDYLYNGEVSEKGDCFAMAVIAFNTLTNVHPFKGIHKKYVGLNERMSHRIPIFANDSQLVVPKCFKPIKDNYLQDQFSRIFEKGERFLIEINKQIAMFIQPTYQAPKTISDIIVNDIFVDQNIDYVISDTKTIGIVSEDKIHIYDLSVKGYSLHKDTVMLEKNSHVFIVNQKLFCLSDGSFSEYDYKLKAFKNKFDGFYIQERVLFSQKYDNIIVAVTNNYLYTIYCESIVGNNIKFEATSTNGLGFKKTYGLLQNFDGNSVVRNKNKNSVDKVLVSKSLKDVYQVDNVGVACYVEKNKIEHKLFRINGLTTEFSNFTLDSLRHIAYKKDNWIVIPNDDKLTMVNPIGFNTIAEIECPLATSSSELFYTEAGIVLREGRNVWLVNKK